MIGQTIGHYRIESKLGEGGMGVVYKARDIHLDRFVALKILSPDKVMDIERKRRFIQEAKAASALSHPNIIHIYDIDAADGVDFIAMEYVHGNTLNEVIRRKGLKLSEALNYAVQIADALAAAHAAGIIHRDIKPSNIIVNENSLIKVLDFGLAKLIEPPEGDSPATQTIRPCTEEGTIVGTAAYMSPEQAEGRKVDARSDIFSFGSVLYEMITGRRAFQGDTKMSTLSAVLHKEPEPVGEFAERVPPELERVIARCLRKDPDRRLRDIYDVKLVLEELKDEPGPDGNLRALAFSRHGFRIVSVMLAAVMLLLAAGVVWWIRVRHGTPIDTLAVLPFINAGGDPNSEYLSEGITESLITGLSRVSRLKVKSRDTVFRYTGHDKDVYEIGRDLGVRAVLKGRLVKRGDSVSISAELVDTSDGTLLWRDQYKRKIADILAIEQEISKEISGQLRLRLSGEQQPRVARSPTRNPEAYRLYLQGRYHWNRRTEEALKKSTEYFQQAIEQDSQYAQAWAGLADSFALLGLYSSMLPTDAYTRGRAAARQAITIEETLAEPHASLALLKALDEWDWPGAEGEFQRALKLDPEYGTAHQWYAFLLAALGRLPEAIAEGRRAREVEPLSPIINANVGLFYYYARQYEEAVQVLQKAVETDPVFFRAHLYLGTAYAVQRKPKQAAAELWHAINLSQRGLIETAFAGSGFGFLGQRDEALKQLEELNQLSRKRYVASFLPAMIYGGMGEREPAFAFFEKAIRERSLLPWYLRDPLLDGIRMDSRFRALLRRIGIPP